MAKTTALPPEGRTQPLLERERELDELTAVIERAASGSGSLAAILGPAGVGKTRLVGEGLRIAAEHGFVCLRARGAELEGSLAFGVARGLLERPLAEMRPPEREGLLKGAARLAAPVLSLDVGVEGGAAPVPGDPTFAPMHGLYWLAANLAQRAPLLLAVDDAHWADAASLRFLAYLARRVEELPSLLLIASRPPEPGSEAELLRALTDDPDARRIVPAPLSAPAAAELLRVGLAVAPEGEFARAVHRATGGNPFLVTSLIASLREREVEPSAAAARQLELIGAEEVGRVVLARLRRLPEASTALAQAVAVLGSGVELHRAARLAELGAHDAAAAADALVEQGILRRRRPLEFEHSIVRAAVYEALAPGERAQAHARAARQLDEDGAAPEELAPHLLGADPAGDAWVVARLRAAADAATARGAPEVAIELLSRALAEPPEERDRPEILRRLGGAEYMVGDEGGVDHLREALASAPTPQLAAAVARELTRALLPMGRFAEAVEALARAVDGLGEADRELALELEAEVATAGRLDPATQSATAQRLGRAGAGIAGKTPAERLVLASLAFQRALAGGTADEVAELGERALDGGLVAEQGPDSPALADVTVALIMAERYERVERALEEAQADARSRGFLIGFAVTSAFRSLLAQRRGAVLEAEGEARTAQEAAAEADSAALEPMVLAFLVEALVDRGELEAAGTALGPFGKGEIPANLMLNFLLHARARTRLAGGELEPGLADLRELARREGELGWHNPSRFAHRSEAAIALARLGEAEEARHLAAEELEIARAWGTPRAIGVALRGLGLATRDGAGIELLRESADTLNGSAAELEHARALVDLGAALRRSGSRAGSREPLAAAMEIAHRCGAATLAEQAREELRATGARPRRMVRTGVDALTPSELRVARMAAGEMTNREIAQALFVTMRAVEGHLTSAYRKLDITSREQLPAVLQAGDRPR